MPIWDITTPLGTESKSLGDDRIREAKAAVQNALLAGQASGVEAVFPGPLPSSNPIYRPRFPIGTTAERPAAGNYGLYFNTTTRTIDRDNGSAWEQFGTGIPAGTVMVFYQAAAPAGWTKVVTQNDRVLRVVSGTGGGTGGTVATSTTLAHAHAVVAHSHTLQSHTHITPVFAIAGQLAFANGLGGGWSPGTTPIAATNIFAGAASGGTSTFDALNTTGSGVLQTDLAGGSTDAQLGGALAYIDVLICSKD